MTTPGSPPEQNPDDSEIPEEADGRIRLHKILAHRGVASRRKSEQLIAAGSVTVDGEVVTEPGTRVDPRHQVILVDGRPLPRESETFLFLFYKPKGVVSTLFDPEGRPTLRDYFPGIDPLLHIGRLDFQTEGALLLTNNGDLSQRILHPRFEIPRTYLVKIQGGMSPAHLERMARGEIRLDGRAVVPLELVPERQTSTNAWYRITLTEGRNREVRRLFETLNYFVLKLVRTAFGPLTLAGLEPGEYRTVTPQETELLLAGTRPQSLPKNLDSRFSRRQDDGASPRSEGRRSRREENAGPGSREPRKTTGHTAPRWGEGGERPFRPRSGYSKEGAFPKARRAGDEQPAEGHSHREESGREARAVPRPRKFDEGSRPEGPARREWSERPKRSDRPERTERSEKTFRSEGRPQKADRGKSAPPRSGRTFSGELDDRPIPRTRKFAGAERPERPARREWTERPERKERPRRESFRKEERSAASPSRHARNADDRTERPERSAPREQREEGRFEQNRKPSSSSGRSFAPQTGASRERGWKDSPSRTKDEGRRERSFGDERRPRSPQGRYERPARPESRSRNASDTAPRRSGGSPKPGPRPSSRSAPSSRAPRDSGPTKRGGRR
ncbi:MAG: pseudouridine synthase [Leptospirillia bacterium]